MTTTETLSGNPFCSVRDEVIDIHYGDKKLKLPVEKVSKIYLSRKKRYYLSFIPGVKFFTFDNSYNLYIRTRDGKETVVTVKGVEKQYFIGLISFVRNKKKQFQITAENAA